jgi:hypothetical protein
VMLTIWRSLVPVREAMFLGLARTSKSIGVLNQGIWEDGAGSSEELRRGSGEGRESRMEGTYGKVGSFGVDGRLDT